MLNNLQEIIKIHNNKLMLNTKMSKEDEQYYIKEYYISLLEKKLKSEIKDTFYDLSKIYDFNIDNFSLTSIYILKNIYDNPKNYSKNINLFSKELFYLKKDNFIRYNSKKNLYIITKKTKNFLFEFNSVFWIEKYKNVINNHLLLLKDNFKFSWEKIEEDFKRELNKEKRYIKDL